MRKLKNIVALGVAAGFSLAIPLAGIGQSQSDGESQSSRDRQSRSSRKSGQQTDRDDRQSSQQRQTQRDSSGSQILVRPEGWIRIGIDRNNDGRVDTWRTIYEFDLLAATERSQQRRGMSGQSRQQQQQRQQQVQGTIESMSTTTLRGHGETKFAVATIESQNGRFQKALLGQKQKLSSLDLQEGDQIRVQGHQGRINGRTVLIARSVQSGGETVNVSPKANGRGREMRRVSGDVTNIHSRRFQDKDEAYMVADLEMDQGPARPIVLGPKSKVDQLNLESGDTLSALVCKGTLNGETALVADELRANGRSVNIQQKPPAQVKDDQGRRSEQTNQSRERNDQARSR